jgi:hypothetical protein
MSAIGVDDGSSRLVAAVAVDQRFQSESDGVRTGTRYSLPHQGVHIGQKALVYARNELRHAFSIADCYAKGKKGPSHVVRTRVRVTVRRLMAARDAGEATRIGERLV